MNEPTQLHDTILEEAGKLFRQQGYAATSIKQIAQAAGCTNAALYYYFERGKRHILHEVIRTMAQPTSPTLSDLIGEPDSLEAFIINMSKALKHNLPNMTSRINWLLLQFPTLPEEEKRFLQDKSFLGLHTAVSGQVKRFVGGDDEANKIAWLIFCSFFGHQQIFKQMGIQDRVDFDLLEYGRFMAHLFSDKE